MSPGWVPASLEILPPAHTHTNRLVRNATNVRSSFVSAEFTARTNATLSISNTFKHRLGKSTMNVGGDSETYAL